MLYIKFPKSPVAFALLSLLACALPSQTQPPPTTGAGAPPKSWVDPDTGHRVLRLTDEPGSASLYFNENGYTSNGRELVYTTPAGFSVIDLTTFKTKPVVTGSRVRVIVAARTSAQVYYTKEGALYTTNADTLATRKIADLPPRGNIAAINADETLAAGTYLEGKAPDYNQGRDTQTQGHPLEQPLNKGAMMVQRLHARIPLVLFTINLNTGEKKELLHSTDWVNHLLFSPKDPSLLMYCHEGPWQEVDRIWTIHTDGTDNTLIHQRKMGMEIAGHEFWSQDGRTVWYDLQTPKGEDFWVAGYQLDSGERTWYHLQRNEWSIHFNVSTDGTLFCGDGGDPGQVAHAPDGEWIYLFHPVLTKDVGAQNKEFVKPGVFHSERLVNMSKHNYHLEPNVSFTPDQKWVIFRSNMFGPTYVFAVEVAKANAQPPAAGTN